MTTNPKPTRDQRAIQASRRGAHYTRAMKIAASQGQASRNGALGVLYSEALDEDAAWTMQHLPLCGGETVREVTTGGRPRCIGSAGYGGATVGHAQDCPRGEAIRAYWAKRNDLTAE